MADKSIKGQSPILKELKALSTGIRKMKTPGERNVEIFGGGVEGKPHSTKKGRTATAKRKFKRVFGPVTTGDFNKGGKV